jgi:hypothetical protein
MAVRFTGVPDGQRQQERVEGEQMGGPVKKDHPHERGQGDHFARQPRGAPHGGCAPRPLRMPEVKERRDKAGDQQCQRHHAARRIEAAVLRMQELEGGIRLDREQGQEQTLAGSDQGRQENDREGGIHRRSVLTMRSRRRATAPAAPGRGSLESILSGLSARMSSSSWMLIRVLRRGR